MDRKYNKRGNQKIINKFERDYNNKENINMSQ